MLQNEEAVFFQNLIDRLCSALDCGGASLYVIDDTGTRLELRAASGYLEPLLSRGVSYRVGEGVTGYIAESGVAVRANSSEALRAHPSYSGKYDAVQVGRREPRSFLAFPLKRLDGRVIGVIKAEEKLGQHSAFTERDEAVATSFGDLATMAITLRREKENLSKLVYAFVLMPFDPQFNDVYQYGIKRPLSDLGIKCERVDEMQYVGGILEQVVRSIDSARFIVADMTGRNPNVFYEVGYCHALKKDVILCTQSAEDIPFDLRGYNHIIYGGKISVLEEALRDRVLGVLRQEAEHETQQSAAKREDVLN
jgi:hypothetical protein